LNITSELDCFEAIGFGWFETERSQYLSIYVFTPLYFINKAEPVFLRLKFWYFELN